MLVRKQILVPAALDKKIRRLAQKRGISQSALIVAAVDQFTADHFVGRARPANQVGATVVIPIAEAASASRLSYVTTRRRLPPSWRIVAM